MMRSTLLLMSAAVLGSAIIGCKSRSGVGEFADQIRPFAKHPYGLSAQRWLMSQLQDVARAPGDHLISVSLAQCDARIELRDRVVEGDVLRCRSRVWYPFTTEDSEVYAVPREAFDGPFDDLYDIAAAGGTCRNADEARSSFDDGDYLITLGRQVGILADYCSDGEDVLRQAAQVLDWRDEGAPDLSDGDRWYRMGVPSGVNMASLTVSLVHVFDQQAKAQMRATPESVDGPIALQSD